MFINEDELMTCLRKQLESHFPFSDMEKSILKENFEEACKRTMKCFSGLANKYYKADDINPYHSGQYTIFLYYLANTIIKKANSNIGKQSSIDNEILIDESSVNKEKVEEKIIASRKLCDKIYMLYKAISSCDLYYEVEMPECFGLDHPMGTVIGRGDFAGRFYFVQGCTVGNNAGKYPRFGDRVMMFSNSKVLGDCNIGNNVLIGANAYIKDMDIPDNSIVYGQYPNVTVKENQTDRINEVLKTYFND